MTCDVLQRLALRATLDRFVEMLNIGKTQSSLRVRQEKRAIMLRDVLDKRHRFAPRFRDARPRQNSRRVRNKSPDAERFLLVHKQ
jgi:hypothetical protein